jgi:cytochrome c-type biogenesis protein CcmF
MLYKLSGTWGNHEGSMLLWVLVLALFGAGIALFNRTMPATLKARTLAVQGLIGVGFLLFILFTSNPFLRLDPAPVDGQDLNPLLQDPGLAFHPPLLYLGYVGLSTAFSFAVAALLEGRVDAAWARWMRPWALLAWATLTLGIALGSWWAYYELGWGGWWFWDPVENASLMPWLAATALIHSALVVERRNAFKAWTLLLAILAFALSLLGTFLVRSGVLTSVHAFAVDPDRGIFILALIALSVGPAFLLFSMRAPQLEPGGLFRPVSREGGLLLNNLFLCAALGTVFVGTLYPLALELAGGDRVSVGPPFFNATFVPLMVPLVVLMGIGPMLSWKKADLAGISGRLMAAGLVAAAAAGVGAWLAGERASVLAVAAVALGVWAIAGALVDLAERVRLFRIPAGASARRLAGLPASAWSSFLGHAGLGIAILGMVGTTAFVSERIEVLSPGETIEVAGYTLRFDTVAEHQGPNYIAEQARLTVLDTEGQGPDGGPMVLLPERRWYPVAGMRTTEAAIRTWLVADLYAVLGDPRGDQGARTFRIYYHPLVPWIWFGSAIMALGGMVGMADRRLRQVRPVPARRTAAGAVQPAE